MEHRRGQASQRHTAAWTAAETAREESARASRIRADAARGPEANLAEGAAFVKFAHELAAAGKAAKERRRRER